MRTILRLLDLRCFDKKGFLQEWYSGVLGKGDSYSWDQVVFLATFKGSRKYLAWWFRPIWLIFCHVFIPILLIACRKHGIRVVVLDLHDQIGFGRFDIPLLHQADLIFKRELPANRWQSFVVASGGIVHPGRFRRGNLSYERILERTRPISLGVPDHDIVSDLDFSIKLFDVFYVGDDRGLRSRVAARRWCMALRDEGFRILMPEGRMSKREFLKALRKSWLCFSPPGNGWDCFRHYEIAGNGSLPVMEHPTIEAYRPFSDKEALLVHFEDVECIEKVKKLLRDEDRKIAMIRESHKKVLAYHTHSALQKYMRDELNFAR